MNQQGCASNYSRNEAIPILYRKQDGKLHADMDNMAKVLRQPELRDKPVCIVSISGAFRKGKSFALNFFLRYLRAKGYENNDWMGGDDKPLDEGFSWRGGRDACTTGILIWSEVFTMVKNGREVAILLMDTQGLFDNQSDNKTNTLIFALSTLISSVQIFNLTQQIQESDLGFLQFFTAYAQAARKDSAISHGEKPFQSLVFLVRDWPYADDLDYGLAGGQEYLGQVLAENSGNSELMAVRKHLKSSFEDTKCCLLPHPGQTVAATKAFKGRLEDIDKTFLRQLDTFIGELFRPEHLVCKKINGKEVTAMTILQYADDCSKGLTDGKLPTPRTMMEHAADAQNFETQKLCNEMYETNMKQTLGDSFVDESFLQEIHEQAWSGAMQTFYERTRFGTEENRKKHRDYVETAMRRQFEMVKTLNGSRKVAAESQVLKLIENLAENYEAGMKEQTDDAEYILEEELDAKHSDLFSEIMNLYSADTTASDQLKNEFYHKLQSKLDRIFDGVKRENEQKRLIQEQQNELERNLMKCGLECSVIYREAMRKEVGKYTEETSLTHTHNTLCRTVLEEFDLKALSLGIPLNDVKFAGYKQKCAANLNEEFTLIQKINAEKREALEKSLESQRSRMYVGYDDTFSALLKDTYLEAKDLQEKHNEVVGKLMSAARTSIGEQAHHIPLYAKHLDLAQKTLEGKYSTIQKWNEKNNTFFRKCMRFVKSIAEIPGLSLIITALKKVLT